ncbi:hypothetical protein [Nocardioides sp. SYSU DS0663]|uniref:hypothetical protein n=1 Tax=Nocardioides sp. SYSU DS0663 TaxID=3416445 RepID=UPI003F4BC975
MQSEPAAVDSSRSPQPASSAAAGLVGSHAATPVRAVTEPLECPAEERTPFWYDRSAPAPDATVADALDDALGEAAASARVVELSPTEVLAPASPEGRVTEVLVVTRWPNGGWAVEGGARCRQPLEAARPAGGR